MFRTLRKPGERSRVPLGFCHFAPLFCLPKRQPGEAVEVPVHDMTREGKEDLGLLSSRVRMGQSNT